MIRLYTKNDRITKRLNDLAIEMQVDQKSENTIILAEPSELSSIKEQFIGSKILVLSQHPKFEEGIVLLQKDINGYGNLYMQKIHLLQALSTIKNGAVWLYPEMMQSLILLGSNAVVDEDVIEALSIREREVAREIEKGLSNKEIASALGITERTVKAHLSHVYEKLEVSDRLALAMLLRK